MKIVLSIFAWALIAQAATTFDRIVAVVGKRAIKLSDIERDLRVTQFLNSLPAQSDVATQKQALERLIDQDLIRSDMTSAGSTFHMSNEAQALLDQIVRERFGGLRPGFEKDLESRGLSEAELLQHLEWQLAVLRFIDQRFRPGVIISDEEIGAYNDQHGRGNLAEIGPKIRETLEAEAINRNFEQWLADTRKSTVVQYKVAALK